MHIISPCLLLLPWQTCLEHSRFPVNSHPSQVVPCQLVPKPTRTQYELVPKLTILSYCCYVMYHTNKNTAHVCHLITTAVDCIKTAKPILNLFRPLGLTADVFFTIFCDENWANSNINVCIITSENWRTNSQWAAVWVSASRNRRDTCFFHSSWPSW